MRSAQTFAEEREQIERSNLCLDATIDDYPIGRRERGKCRLQVKQARLPDFARLLWASPLA